MQKVWTLGVSPDSIPDTLLLALSIGGTKYVVRPRSHDVRGRPKVVATVYNVDERPLFSKHGGLPAVATGVAAAFRTVATDPACEAVQEVYKEALADPRLDELFKIAVIHPCGEGCWRN
eukprot:SAG11_NODE_7649_length_1115_cov_1.613189_1_plen_118_part_10